MHRVAQALGLLSTLTVVSCTSSQTISALRVTIALNTPKSVCVGLEVTDANGRVKKSTRNAVLNSQQQSILAVVYADGLSETISIQAVGYQDESCRTLTEPPERSEKRTVTFRGDLTDLQLTFPALDAPDGGTDLDGDGFPSPLDCDDRNAAVNPIAIEVCTDRIDNNCNQLLDCEDITGCPGGSGCGIVGAACNGVGACAEAVCDDRVDNDADELVDCSDPDCSNERCVGGGRCTAVGCIDTRTETGMCDDGIDNDQKNGTDCADPSCDLQPCSDGLMCALGARCIARVCLRQSTVVCAQQTVNACLTRAGQCLRDGGCAYPPSAAGTTCEDGDGCTQADACDGDGGCVGRMPKACNTPPASGCFRTTGTCQSPSGMCVYEVDTQRTCSDQNDCTLNDACLGDGGCAGTPRDCSSPPNECQTATNTCRNGQCVFSNRTGLCSIGVCENGQCLPTVDPSNVPLATIQSVAGPPALNIACNTEITLSPFGLIANGCSVPTPRAIDVGQPNGVTLKVVVLSGLTVASGARVTVRAGGAAGPAANALVFAVRGDATINGTLDVSGEVSNGAAVGGTGGNGSFCPFGVNGASIPDRGGGGHGGAFGTASGAGGANMTGDGAAPSQGPNGNEALVPLRGGCPGSLGGLSSARASLGGGAIQVWTQGRLTVSGTIIASGMGGAGGSTQGSGGSGGGSGGGILLEGFEVSLAGSAVIAANGGSGGEGRYQGTPTDGVAGGAGTAVAVSPPGGSICGGDGANGGARSTAPLSGQQAPGCMGTGYGGGGGGGGSVGRIRFNARRCVAQGGARISPQPTSGSGTGCTP